jgi:hypothetical protein
MLTLTFRARRAVPRWSWLLVCAVMAVVSCRFKPYVPPGRLRCTADVECPSGLTCEQYQGSMRLCCRSQYCEADEDFVPPTGPTDGGASTLGQCALYAVAHCSRLKACSDTTLRLRYGTETRCRDRVQKSCALLRALPGVTWPSKACTDATGIQACSTFTNEGAETPAECREQGGGADGAPCSDELQCQGRRCVAGAGSCQTCARRSAAGGGCVVDADCAFGLRCGGATCVKPGESGATCDAGHPCRSTFVCKSGSCVDLGGQGAPCADDTECQLGFSCDAVTRQCGKLSVSDTTCGGPYQACSSYQFCDTTLRKCQPHAADGASCQDFASCFGPASCDGDTCKLPTPNLTCAPMFVKATNNSAEIAGAVIGRGTKPNDSLRKALTPALAAPAPVGFEVTGAFAFDDRVGPVSSPEQMSWAIAVKNSGAETRCGIQAGFVVFQDAAGTNLDTARDTRLQGSIGTQGGSDFFWFEDCLATGETGYLVGIQQKLSFDAVARVQLMLDAGTLAAPAAIKVIPESYVVTASSVVVTVKNEGDVPVQIPASSLFLWADAQGPVGKGYLFPDVSLHALNPGETITLSDQSLSGFPGQADRLRVILSLQKP